EFTRLFLALLVRGYEALAHQMLFTGEGNDVEPVSRVERADSVTQRGLGLVHLALFGHRSGSVQDEDHLIRRDYAFVKLGLRLNEQQEETILARLAVCQ